MIVLPDFSLKQVQITVNRIYQFGMNPDADLDSVWSGLDSDLVSALELVHPGSPEIRDCVLPMIPVKTEIRQGNGMPHNHSLIII